jgi:hypothetical protein
MQISDDRTPKRDGRGEEMPEHKARPIEGLDFDLIRERPEFSNLLFSTRVTEDGRPVNPTDRLPSGVSEVYASFDYDSMRNRTPWSAVWMNDGKIIIEQKDVWDDGEEGRKTVKIANSAGIPNGSYNLVLGIGGEVALEGDMHVGPTVDESDSEISGRLVDSRTGKPIANGLVVVLKPNASLRKFLKDRREQYVQSSVETDRDGRFTLPDQLPKGQAYSLVAAASGFRAITVEHALRISHQAPEHADVGDLEMDRA